MAVLGAIPATSVLTPADVVAGSWTNISFSALTAQYSDTAYNTCQYTKDAFGVVHLRGLIAVTSSTFSSWFTLPAGFLPINSTNVYFVVRSNSGPVIVFIDASGSMWPVNAGSTYGWLSLDGMSFYAGTLGGSAVSPGAAPANATLDVTNGIALPTVTALTSMPSHSAQSGPAGTSPSNPASLKMLTGVTRVDGAIQLSISTANLGNVADPPPVTRRCLGVTQGSGGAWGTWHYEITQGTGNMLSQAASISSGAWAYFAFEAFTGTPGAQAAVGALGGAFAGSSLIEPWTAPTLQNSFFWVNYETPAYTRDALGWVHLKGRVTGGVAVPTNSPVTIFTLPVGYRPAKHHIFAVAGGSALSLEVRVQSDGLVIAQVYSGNTDFLWLDGISFRTT